MKHTRIVATAALLLMLPALGGCNRGSEPAAQPAGDEGLDGLSSDQIREQAESMSPEQAEELGIIDTTIHLEQLTSPEDSAILRNEPRIARDTAS